MINHGSYRFASALAAIGVSASLSGCSTVETASGGPSVVAAGSPERIQLKVQTGSDALDARVYELAYEQFSTVMPLREAPPYTAALEIIFASAEQNALVGATGTTVSGHGDWYTGGRPAGTSATRGASLTWQNSTMSAVLKHADGEQTWSATYRYNGGYELSGFVVHTPEQAARLIVKRLTARFLQDERVAETKK